MLSDASAAAQGEAVLIQNAGYMWHRRYIDWGRGRLIGVPKQSGGREVDFAHQSAIYGLYDHDHRCVYIGQAGKGERRGLFDRLKDHALEDELFCMWERVTWFGLYSEDDLRADRFADPLVVGLSLEETLNSLESLCIYLALPPFSRKLSAGVGPVAWYYQAAEYDDNRRGTRDSTR